MKNWSKDEDREPDGEDPLGGKQTVYSFQAFLTPEEHRLLDLYRRVTRKKSRDILLEGLRLLMARYVEEVRVTAAFVQKYE